MIAMELLYRRIRLFLRIVWRTWERGYRLSAKTSWGVACDIYTWEDYQKVCRYFDTGPHFKITNGVW